MKKKKRIVDVNTQYLGLIHDTKVSCGSGTKSMW